jgi:uridine kinase
MVSEDRYYRDLSHLSPAEREGVNFDHPDAIDWEALAADLRRLRAGGAAEIPRYDFRSHTRLAGVERIEPRPLVIVEGILLLHVQAVREQLDLKLYLDVAPDIRFIRRLQRDIRERGRTVDSVIRQYLETVSPMYEKFVRPTARFADMVLDTAARIDVEPIERRIREIAARPR